jgi:hypothetical protein
MIGTVWHVTMSLDGFIACPDDAMDWAFQYGEPSSLAEEVMRARARFSPAAVGMTWRHVALASETRQA